MKTVVIVNPRSGKFNIGPRLEELKDLLAGSVLPDKILFTTARGEGKWMAREAISAGAEKIIVAGGDGILNEVVNGMAGSEARLGILPAGCRNVFARELGIPLDFRHAIDLIVSGRTRLIDLGSANRRYYTTMIGVGLDAAAVQEAEANLLTLKKFLRAYAYHLAGMRMLFSFKTRPFTVLTGEGESFSGCAAVIANGHFYGGSHEIVPHARVDDGRLDLCLFKKGEKLDYLRYFLGVLTGRHQKFKDVLIRPVTGLKIEAPGIPYHVDGDFGGFTPVEVQVRPRALRVITPPFAGE